MASYPNGNYPVQNPYVNYQYNQQPVSNGMHNIPQYSYQNLDPYMYPQQQQQQQQQPQYLQCVHYLLLLICPVFANKLRSINHNNNRLRNITNIFYFLTEYEFNFPRYCLLV